jgi:hypothetical protein
MIAGFGIGISFSILAFAIIALINDCTYDNYLLDWNEKTDRECLSKYGKIQITVVVLVLCLSTFIGARIHIRMFERDVRQFESAKATYSESIKSEDVSGLERIEIVNKITEENKTLARLKYDATKWYYFYLPDNLVDNLEPIKLS